MDNLLIGGMIGFLSAIGKDLIMKYFDSKEKTNKFYLVKLEEIFYLTDKLSDNIIKTPMRLADVNSSSSHEYDETASKLAMLIRFYIPNLEEIHKKFITACGDTTKYFIDYSSEKTDYGEVMKNYFDIYLDFKKQIINESENYKKTNAFIK